MLPLPAHARAQQELLQPRDQTRQHLLLILQAHNQEGWDLLHKNYEKDVCSMLWIVLPCTFCLLQPTLILDSKASLLPNSSPSVSGKY